MVVKDFGLAQILELDEDGTSEANVVSADFADPYVLLVKDDQTIKLLSADESGDLEEIEQGDQPKASKWTSGSLYDDSNDLFRLEFGEDEEASNILLFLLTAGGGLHVSY